MQAVADRLTFASTELSRRGVRCPDQWIQAMLGHVRHLIERNATPIEVYPTLWIAEWQSLFQYMDQQQSQQPVDWNCEDPNEVVSRPPWVWHRDLFEPDRRLEEHDLKTTPPEQTATDQFLCRRCHKRECVYYSAQIRSADEGMTLFVTCVNPKCGYRWRQ